MVGIKSVLYEEVEIQNKDIFICAMGYEQRSFYLYNELKGKVNDRNVLVLVFEDYSRYEKTRIQVEKIRKLGIHNYQFEYYDSLNMLEKIEKFVENLRGKENITIHVDYSSMPRSLYCQIPQIFEKTMREGDEVYFWYVEGEYPDNYEEYPSAGIESFSLFSGKPSLRMDKKRVHVLSLGFDVVRTQAMISILDPESLIVCNAYNSSNKTMRNNVKKVNKDIISQARMIVSVQLDDFSFMLSKMCELAYEYQPIGDVVFIPDGPKPMIMAISLVPHLVNLEGVTCLHIARNREHFNVIDVIPKGKILGFVIQK